MTEIEVTERINAPADRVWNLVNWRGLESIAKSEFQGFRFKGEGIGAVRWLDLPNGDCIKERLEDCSAEDRWYIYRVIDNGPLPWTDYTGRILVTPSGPGVCAVKFSCRLTPVSLTEQECRDLYVQRIRMGIDNIRKLAE